MISFHSLHLNLLQSMAQLYFEHILRSFLSCLQMRKTKRGVIKWRQSFRLLQKLTGLIKHYCMLLQLASNSEHFLISAFANFLSFLSKLVHCCEYPLFYSKEYINLISYALFKLRRYNIQFRLRFPHNLFSYLCSQYV